MIDQIIEYNKEFVAEKGYEKYITDKYPDKKNANTYLHRLISRRNKQRKEIVGKTKGRICVENAHPSLFLLL